MLKKAFKYIKALNYRLEFLYKLIKQLKNSDNILETYFEDQNKKEHNQLQVNICNLNIKVLD